SRSVISSSYLEGTHGLEALLRGETAGPCRNPPLHIKPLGARGRLRRRRRLRRRLRRDDGHELAVVHDVDLVDDCVVVAGSTVDHVTLTVRRVDGVGSGPGVDVVGARPARDHVVATAAVDRVVTGAAVDRVVAAEAED